MLSITTPYIIKSSVISVISAGQQYNCFVKTILSKGSLHFNRLPDKPINTSFLDREIPVYELVENPPWLQIRPNDGFLFGIPDKIDRNQYKVIIKCSTHLGVSYAETSIKVI